MADQDIKYQVTADDRFSRTFANLKRDLGQVREKSDEFVAVAGRVNSALGLVALGAAGAGVGLAAGIRNLARDIDALNDASDAIGDSVENISAVEAVALRNGESLDLVTGAVFRLNKALGEGADPDSAISRSLKQIGLNARELAQSSPTEALQRIAVALQRYENDGDRARIVTELFGKSSKEVAAFLADLAAAGKLNATITSEQAAEAEKFNKELSAMEARSISAARAMAGPLLSAINGLFDRFKDNGVKGLLGISKMDEELAQVRRLQAAAAKAAGDLQLAKFNPFKALVQGPEVYKADLDKLQAAYDEAFRIAEAARVKYLRLTDGAAGAGRGFVNPELAKPKVGALPDKDKPAKAPSEAERYLEQLQRQGERLDKLTVLEQALADVQAKRITGLTPALERSIVAEAKAVDAKKQRLDLEQAEIDSRSRAAKAAADQLAQAERENEAMAKENEAIGLTKASLADLELARLNATIATKQQTVAKQEAAGVDERQLQMLQAEIAALERRKELIVEGVRKTAEDDARKAEMEQFEKDLKKPVDEFTKEAQRNIQNTLAGSLRAVFSGEFDQIGSLFKRLLVDMAAQAAAARIGRELFGDFLGGGDLGGSIGNLFKLGANFLGIPGFAGGGNHAGGLRVVGERGPELEATGPARYWNASQTTSMLAAAGSGGGAAPVLHYAPVYQVQGSDREQILSEVRRMDAQSKRELMSYMRDKFGG